jgi:hypothetical protein
LNFEKGGIGSPMNSNGNRKRTLRERFTEFMYGRNGIDAFYYFLLWTIIILTLLNLYFRNTVLSCIEILIFVYAAFRVLSRNVYRRQKENQIYLSALTKIRRFFAKIKRKVTASIALLKNKWRDRKTHVYKKCPKCKNTLRLPKVKGKHTAACPCCDNRFDVRII